MDFSEHLALSVPASAAIYLATGDPWAAAAFCITGVLIDTDHLLDYWRETGINLQRARFMTYFNDGLPRHLLLFLHAWEWPAAWLAVSLALQAPLWAYAAAAGWLAHLVQDQRYNGLQPWSYFFAYRWRTGFDTRATYTHRKP